MAVAVEVCVSDPEEVIAATDRGVDSVEVCSWLDAGGVTPGWGTIRTAQEAWTGRVRVLLRPNGGGFCYSEPLKKALLYEVEHLRDHAVNALVIGALTPSGAVDVPFMRQVMALHPDAEITFHRAIDRAPDMRTAFGQCLDLGIHRVLSSGGAPTAMEGADMLSWMVRHGGGALKVAAAGRIGARDVVRLVERTGVEEVHFSAQLMEEHGTAVPGAHRSVPDREKIMEVIHALHQAGLR